MYCLLITTFKILSCWIHVRIFSRVVSVLCTRSARCISSSRTNRLNRSDDELLCPDSDLDLDLDLSLVIETDLSGLSSTFFVSTGVHQDNISV